MARFEVVYRNGAINKRVKKLFMKRLQIGYVVGVRWPLLRTASHLAAMCEDMWKTFYRNLIK